MNADFADTDPEGAEPADTDPAGGEPTGAKQTDPEPAGAEHSHAEPAGAADAQSGTGLTNPTDVLGALDPARRLVLVSVGTDVHRFERLIDWVQRWLDTPAAQGVQVVVQHGTSRAPTGCLAVELLPLTELTELMRRASVVVAQGGPGGILDARTCGNVPIVVARHHRLGEHVDDHQVAFTNRLARDGFIQLASDEQQFAQLLDAALADPDSVRLPIAEQAPAPEAATRLAAEVTALVQRKPPRRLRKRG